MQKYNNRRKHYLGVLDIFRTFDNWTLHKYHKMISKRILEKKIEFYVFSLRYLKKKILKKIKM
jgi:hypothetical protein